MIQVKHVRVAARLWFIIAIIAAGVLSMLSLQASAGPLDAKPERTTQTGAGGPPNPGRNRWLGVFSNRQQQYNPEQFIEWGYSTRVRQELADGQRAPIGGRDMQVQRISNGLDDMNRVVAIQGGAQSGRESTVEQYVAENVLDNVIRIKSRELADVQPPSERARLMNEIIKLVEARSKSAAGPGRTVMYVDNLDLLNMGHQSDYLASKSIVQAVARGSDVGILLKTSGRTLTLLSEDSPHFRAVTRVVELPNADLDLVLDFLNRERANIEARAGVNLTGEALVEAARQATRYFADSPFNAAQRLLLIAARELRSEQAGSPSAVARLNQDISRLNFMIQTLEADLARQDNAEKRQQLKDLKAQVATLENKKGGFQATDRSNITTQADLQNRIDSFKKQLAELDKPWYVPQRFSKPHRDLLALLQKAESDLAAHKNASAVNAGTPGARPAASVTPDFVQRASSQESGMSLEAVSTDAKTGTARLSEINDEIFGAEERVERVRQVMIRWVKEQEELEEERRKDPRAAREREARMDASSRRKPIGIAIASGPTGTAKTDLYMKIAEKLGMKVIKIDMSNYNQEHHGSGLIGAKPEYIGFGKPGELTGPVRQHPFVMIILDELTRAHLEVIKQATYPVLDFALLKDSEGNPVDFSKAFIVGTTNADEEVARMSRAELLYWLMEDKGAGPIEREWTAKQLESKSYHELRARALEWILKGPKYNWEESMVGRWFQGIIDTVTPHTAEQKERIAHKLTKNLVNKFTNKKIQIVYSEAAFDALLKTYDPARGARSIMGTFETEIANKVYTSWVDDKVKPGQVLVIDFVDGHFQQVVTSVESLDAAKGLANERRTRVQQALVAAGQKEDRAGIGGGRLLKIFEESYMIKQSVLKALRRAGRS